jgi:hypothetical protein
MDDVDPCGCYPGDLQLIRTLEAERDALRRAFDDIIVWAARYAHGRATYAPSDVRRAVGIRKHYDPDWQVTGRVGLEPLTDAAGSLPSDDLTDLFPSED